MQHIMHLDESPFSLIKNGIKTIELRVYDDKRRTFKKNDTIKIINRKSNETILVLIEELYVYDSFEELYKHLDEKLIVFKLEELDKFYPKEEQKEFGVVGIQLKLID